MSKPKLEIEKTFSEASGTPYPERLEQALQIFQADAENKQNWEKYINPNSVFLPDHPLIKDKNTESVFEVTPNKHMANYYGALHGGCVATLVDIFTSLSIMACEDPPGLAVSVVMNIEYIKAIPITDKVIIHSKVDKFGRSLAFSTCKIYDSKLDLCYTASHTKMRMALNKMKDKL